MKKQLAKAAYKLSEVQANQSCPWFLYQSKMPDKVKKLNKLSK